MEMKTPLLRQEFLDFKINEYLPGFREEHKEEYDIIFDFIKILNSIEVYFTGKADTQQAKYLLSYIVELDKLFQSTILMFERGLPRSANILIRSILEVSLNIVDIIKNEKHVQDKLSISANEILHSLNIIEKQKMFDVFSEEKILELKKIASSMAGKKIAQQYKPNKLSEKYGFFFEYLLYRKYCEDTHMSIDALIKNISDFQEKVIIEKDFDFKDFKNNVFVLTSCANVAIATLLNEYLKDNKLICAYDLTLSKMEKVFT